MSFLCFGVSSLPVWFQNWGTYLGDMLIAIGIAAGLAVTIFTGRKDAIVVALGSAAISQIIPVMLTIANMDVTGQPVAMDGMLGIFVSMSILLSEAVPLFGVVFIFQKLKAKRFG